jgi:hypothetical protein
VSGKRQHYIPQFLQKGFDSHSIGDEVFTWVFRKGEKPFNPNINNVGVEGYFYSENGDQILDETISSAETGYAELVESIRKSNSVNKAQSKAISELIAHLEVRTRNIRQNFLNSTNYMIDKFGEYLSDPDSCERFIRRKIIDDPSMLKESLSKEIAKRGLSQELIPIILQKNSPFIEYILPNMVKNMLNFNSQLKSKMPSILKQSSKQGQLKALSRGLSPPSKASLLANLNYEIICSENADFILGDSIVIYKVKGHKYFTPFLWKKDILEAVFLPISKKQIVVGSTKKIKVDLLELQKKIAACSLEYFIASECNPRNINLQEFISDEAPLLTTSQIEKLIGNYLEY